MDIIIPLLGGISAKLYDDIIDEKIEVNDIIKECLKGVQWMILAILSVNDFNFILIFYVMNVLNYIGNPSAFSGSYEFSLLLMVPLLFVLNFDTIHSFHYIDILIIISFFIVFFVEPILIPNNVSYTKLIFRSIGTLFLILYFLWRDYLQISPSIMKINNYLIGYGTVSVMFQIYSLYRPRSESTPEPNEIILKTKE
jgi:hypothetical protein